MLFPNGQLGGDPSALSQLRLGAIQFYLTNPGSLANLVPAASIGFLGFAFKDDDEGLRVMDGPVGEYLQSEFAAKGLQAFMPCWTNGMNQTGSSSHPIRTADDMKGFKIRVPAIKIFFDLFKELGASPVALDLNELYTGLQTRIVDGEALPLTTIETSRLYEVNKYISLTNQLWSSLWVIANGDVWKALPRDLRTIVEHNNTKYGLLQRRDIRLLGSSIADKLTRQGIVVNRVDQASFRSRLSNYYQYWSGVFGTAEWNLLEQALGRRIT